MGNTPPGLPIWLLFGSQISFPFNLLKVYLLYVDESGSVSDPKQRYFVLAGVCVFERSTHWIEQELNEIAVSFSPENPHAIELHGSPMRSGREGWKTFPLAARMTALNAALQKCIADRKLPVFAAVIDKQAAVGIDPVSLAFEQLVSRFDLFLKRRHLRTLCTTPYPSVR